jgi:hypothetical protein
MNPKFNTVGIDIKNQVDFDLRNYLKIYPNYFDSVLCNNVIESLKSPKWGLHRYYTSEGNYISTETDLSITHEPIPETDTLHEATFHLLTHHIRSQGFDWYNAWREMSPIRFNKYDLKTNMQLHCDHIHSLFDGEKKGVPILSIVTLLNDDFEGGDFIMWGEKIPMSQGTVIIFPSNFLYPHAVTPVTLGTRYSFVQWTW